VVNDTREPAGLREKDIAKVICETFSKNGYSCQINRPLELRGMRLISDVFCQKGREKVSIEIKIVPYVDERDLRQLISYSRFAADTRWFLCISSSTELKDEVKAVLQQANIGLLLFGDGKIKIESMAVSYLELRNRLVKSIYALTREHWDKYKSQIRSPEFNPEEPLRFWRTGKGKYAHRVTPKEIKDSYRNTLLAYQQKLSLIDAVLEASIPFQRRISSELLDRTSKLKNIHYARQLLDFEKKYRNADSSESEYQIVLETLEKLWTSYEKERGATAFKAYKEFEPLLKEIPGYRDHMIHPFQVFLMGAIIIDSLYESFNRTYKTKLQNSKKGDMDFAWLLCSTFHDFCYPIQMYEFVNHQLLRKFLQIEDPSILPRLPTERILIQKGQLKLLDQLISLFCHYMNDAVSSSWVFDSECRIDDTLRFTLMQEITNNKNHAPLSALTLLNMILGEEIAATRERYVEETFSTAVCPAALAIAIHDFQVLQNFPQNLNIPFESMPIPFLLIYCDTAQEFGRSEQEKQCSLKSLSLSGNLVECTLAFSAKSDY
jgi:hypothetical protein